MKKFCTALVMLSLCITTVCAGCSKTKEPVSPPQTEQTEPHVPVYRITASQTEVTVHEDDFEGFNFASLFSATLDGAPVAVKAEWLDLSQIAGGNSGVITCSVGGSTASVTVTVQKAVYTVTASESSIELYPARAEKFDYLSLFTVTRDGKPFLVTADMISSDVKKEVGVYHYTVTAGGVSATVTVNIVEGHYLEIVNSYKECVLTLSELNELDVTSLFTLYVDDEVVRVTKDMVDASALQGAVVGGEYEVSISYETEDGVSSIEKTCKVRIVEEAEIVISHTDIVTYPNSAIIDLTTLFTVTVNGEPVKVTSDMIEGTVDYTTVGEYKITLTFRGQSDTATVKVENGVVIRYKNGGVVQIKKGTNKDLYDFGADFVVIIGGIVFDNVNFCVDRSAVDFNTAGDYTATIRIDYNTAKLVMNNPPAFTTVTKDIVYRVIENEYEVRLKNELVILPAGTTSYNAFNNIELFVNGTRNTITDRRDWVIVNVCYGKLLTPVDFTVKGEQTVTVALYVNGIGADEASDPEPILVSYRLIVESDIRVEAHNLSIISGTTFYTRDLFTVTENGVPVEISEEHISGKVDVFTPGTYTVSISYEGISASARVVVYDSKLLGTYHTRLRTFARPFTGSVAGDYDDEETFVSKRLGDLIFSADGKLVVNGLEFELGEPIDENTMRVHYRTTEYTLHYENGIIVLNPENNYHMQLLNERRPLIYFNEAVYNNDKYITITYSSAGTYVLSSTTSGNYSIDAFHLIGEDGSEKWYALYVKLASVMNSNWLYEIKWGEIEFAEGFDTKIGVLSSAVMDGTRYNFRVNTATLAIIEREGEIKKYAGMRFTGSVDGKSAELSFNSYQHVTFKVGTETLVSSLTSSEIDAMKNGGFDYDNDELFIYLLTPESGKSIYSYKFKLDVKSRTFTLVERDGVFGKYLYANKYIYLDGYGTGHICFNTASLYVNTLFDYTLKGNEIEIVYRDTLADFKYGTGASFYLAPLGNVLTIKSFGDSSVPDTAAFTNAYITDGAIIRYSLMTIGALSETEAVNEIYRNIEIVTSEGVLTGNALKNSSTVSVDLTRVQYGTEGFYRIQIKVPYGGRTVTVDYAVQIVSDRYASEPVAKSYGSGILNPNNGISIAANGLASVRAGGELYSGYAIISGGSFVIIAKDAAGNQVRVEGVMLEEGLVRASCRGAQNFTDYFTTGTVRSAAGSSTLHAVALSEKTVYLYIPAFDYLGAVYDEEDIEVLKGSISEAGCILKIGGDVVKVTAWGDLDGGLVLSDAYRGTYTAEADGETLILDGFGALTLGGVAGTYMLHDANRATVILPSGVAVYRLSTNTWTYRVLDYSLDNTLLENKKMQTELTFAVDTEIYRAQIVLSFQKNGVVNIAVTSDYEGYQPVIAGTGTFTVSGNTLSITINGYTIKFTITDVIKVDRLVCTETNVPLGRDGYFARGTAFTPKTESSESSGGSSGGSGGSSSDWDDWYDGGDWDD